MRWIAWALLLVAGIHSPEERKPSGGRVVEVSTVEELMDALREPLDHVTLELSPGEYDLTRTSVRLAGRGARLIGQDPDHVAIVTHGVGGIYFKDCVDCVIEAVTVTDGTRDSNSKAREPAIFAVNSSARIANCVIRDTGGQGIVAGRQTLLTIENCEILRNALDGISICDDAHAIIRNNLIEGLGSEGLGRISRTSCAAVLIGCDAQAIIERNHVREYDVGISTRGSVDVEVRANIVEGMRNSGIACMADSLAMPRAIIESNVVYLCDAGGILVRGRPRSADAHGRVSRNLIVGTGINTDHPSRGAIVLENVPDGFVVHKNTCYDNAKVEDSLNRDVPREKFWRERRPWTRTYRNTPVGVDGRHKFHETAFLTRYGKWLN
jgi:Right handed beta helix region